MLCSGRPCANGRALARAPCLDLGERGSRGRVDDVIAKPEPPMLLALPRPHDGLSIEVLGARIVVCPMEQPRHLSVLTDAGVDAGFVYASGGSSRLKETSDVDLPLWAIHHAWKSEQAWPLCDADCEKEAR